MEKWLHIVLTDISNEHKINENKAKILLDKLLALFFSKRNN